MNKRALPIRVGDRRCARRAALRLLVLGLAAAWPLSATADEMGEVPLPHADSRELRATGMTFVASRNETSELVLKSRFATFHPESNLAHLVEVNVVATDEVAGENFAMTCDRAELNVETNDFRAEGDVRGSTSEGQRYSAPWVEYDHAAGLLHTDAPVRMLDGTGSFRGDGFRYRVEDRTFRLMGNVSVEQVR